MFDNRAVHVKIFSVCPARFITVLPSAGRNKEDDGERMQIGVKVHQYLFDDERGFFQDYAETKADQEQ